MTHAWSRRHRGRSRSRWAAGVSASLLALALYGLAAAVWSQLMTPDARATAGGASNVTRQYSPAAQAAVTTSAGDNNGFQTSPTSAFASDNVDAVDSNSGADDNAACTGTGTDKHRFYTYGIDVPTGSAIKGIQVRADIGVDNLTDTPFTCVRLSYDGGTSLTTEKKLYLTAIAETTYLYGSSSDVWGRTWSATELNDTNFRVEVINGDEDPGLRFSVRDFSLDWLPATVTYTAPWDSYTTSARTTVSDLYSGSPKTVYMRGTGFSTGSQYRVAYYDAGGTKRFEEGPLSVSGGNLDSAITTSNYPTATAGSWRAVVQRSGATAFPATYASINQDTHEILAEDTFTVNSSAIPEFPDLAAALVASFAGAGCYYVLRRRMDAARTTV